jgi:hypothetical protein
MRIYLLREGFALIPTLKGGVFTLCPLHSPEINALQGARLFISILGAVNYYKNE